MQLTKKQCLWLKQKIKLSDEKYLVRIDVSENEGWLREELNYNIYHIDKKNNIIWQVTETKTKVPFDEDPFCYVGQNEKGEIIARRFSGFIYKINPETGEATRIAFHK